MRVSMVYPIADRAAASESEQAVYPDRQCHVGGATIRQLAQGSPISTGSTTTSTSSARSDPAGVLD